MSQQLFVKEVKPGSKRNTGFTSNGGTKKIVTRLFLLLVGVNLVVVLLANLFNLLGNGSR